MFDSIADELRLELDERPAFAIKDLVRNQRQELSKQELDTFVTSPKASLSQP
jgi:hypothetical protein